MKRIDINAGIHITGAYEQAAIFALQENCDVVFMFDCADHIVTVGQAQERISVYLEDTKDRINNLMKSYRKDLRGLNAHLRKIKKLIRKQGDSNNL